MTTATILFRTAVAVTAACVAYAAHAQVMTAPATVKAPVTAPTIRPTAVLPPYVVRLSYAVPGQNPPTAVTSFAAAALSFSQTASQGALALGRPGTAPVNEVDVTVDISSGSPPGAIPAQGTTLTSMTITENKAGATIMTMNFAGAVLVSRAFSPASAGAPRELLRFFYTQVTHTP